MSQKLQSVRGTQDIFGDTSKAFRKIDQTAFKTATNFGYEEISTPIFEFSEVFHRTLGETSDAVTRETYTFQDRGGDEITLRPEGTAGIARAFISNGFAQNLPLKYYYIGPMFRYERPQKGRFRQFHQFGVECLGLESAVADVECLALGYTIFKKLGVLDKINLEINSLGDAESRALHRQRLVEYLKDFEKDLSADSKIRLVKNPLRILDSKDPGDQKILNQAPLLKDCLNSFSQEFFSEVLSGLNTLSIPFLVNDRLVRGLDYYTHTVFEFTTTHLGAQGAVLAGGRYDGLIETMGGPRTPGVGWASGVERMALLLNPEILQETSTIIAVLSADEKAEAHCLKLTHELREKDIAAELIAGGNVGKKMKRANKIGAKYAVIVGETEIQNKTVTLKDLKSGTQESLSEKEMLGRFNADPT